MPAMSDADIAAIMTYVRQAWDNNADPVDTALVTRVRKASPGRSQPWSPQELDTPIE